jgi:hypothetical protein
MPEPSPNRRREPCDACDRRTAHEVSIELAADSEKDRNSRFAAKPCRVAECTACGLEVRNYVNQERESAVLTESDGR